jgi:hypothetical protein
LHANVIFFSFSTETERQTAANKQFSHNASNSQHHFSSQKQKINQFSKKKKKLSVLPGPCDLTSTPSHCPAASSKLLRSRVEGKSSTRTQSWFREVKGHL